INIGEALKKGQFREDLFYRLNVIPIEIPPLRERPEDIIPLVKYFLGKFSLFYKKQIVEIEENALEVLLNYSWPGNIRELENAIEFAFVRTTKKSIIETAKLPLNITGSANLPYLKSFHVFAPDSKERTDLLNLLEKNQWNRSKVAKEMNLGRTTLWRKMKKLGLTDN
ncbi:MAG: helix-turn-helix domain-containing protein, partial [Melioribacteraceae bacterium]